MENASRAITAALSGSSDQTTLYIAAQYPEIAEMAVREREEEATDEAVRRALAAIGGQILEMAENLNEQSTSVRHINALLEMIEVEKEFYASLVEGAVSVRPSVIRLDEGRW